MINGRRLNTTEKADILSIEKFKTPFNGLSKENKHKIVKFLASTMSRDGRRENGGKRE